MTEHGCDSIHDDAVRDVASPPSPDPLVLRAKEAAHVLGISKRTLWTLTNAHEIPHVRVGRSILYPVDLLREWLLTKGRASVRNRSR